MPDFADYTDILELFNKHDVRYLVVGAYAMGNFGYTRHTHDIDLWVDKTEENASKIHQALGEFGVPFSIEPDDFMKENSIIQIGLPPKRIDILTDVDGVEFRSSWDKRVEGTLFGVKTNIISLQDLIINKSSTDRPKDKVDVIQLKELEKYKN